MKKRLIITATALLLLAALLCSCTAGLPFSELALCASGQTAQFSSRVENLLAKSAVLAINGKTDFGILLESTASAEVQAVAAAFCAQFRAYSGAELPQATDATAHRILIGRKDTATAKEILKDLAPTSFYIGMAENDLLILAHNDVMLCAALRYFSDTYLKVQEDTSATGDLFLPGTLAYTAPTLHCENGVYTIVRAEKSGELAINAMSRLHDAIYAAGGVRMSIKSDFNYVGSGTDILVGYPDHPKSNPILATLPHDAYYIGMQDQTLMILANNDLMLEKAVDHFLSLFLTGNTASRGESTKYIDLPAQCDYYHTEPSILLTEGGVNHAVLVYPHDASPLAHTAIQSLCKLYKQLTNTDLEAYADTAYERVEGVFEILFGRTNRSESQQLYFDGIEKGAWHFRMDEGGKALALGANGEFALKAAIEALGSALRTQTAALSREAIDDGWNLKEGKDRLLYLSLDFAQSGAEVPDLSGTYTYRVYTYSYTMQQKNATAAQYDEYCAVLEEAGFHAVPQDSENAYRAVYQLDKRSVTVTYNSETRVLNVQVGTRWQR